eukprot:12659231-Alexandrium_andersonii.AAC.1
MHVVCHDRLNVHSADRDEGRALARTPHELTVCALVLRLPVLRVRCEVRVVPLVVALLSAAKVAHLHRLPPRSWQNIMRMPLASCLPCIAYLRGARKARNAIRAQFRTNIDGRREVQQRSRLVELRQRKGS